MKFKFNYQNEKREIDIKLCDSALKKARGLMFGNDKKPLLFVFKNKKKRAIHSFFCKPFYAIWFNGDKIIGEKIVEGWRVNVKPVGDFDKLLEIPSGCREFLLFPDGRNI